MELPPSWSPQAQEWRRDKETILNRDNIANKEKRDRQKRKLWLPEDGFPEYAHMFMEMIFLRKY